MSNILAALAPINGYRDVPDLPPRCAAYATTSYLIPKSPRGRPCRESKRSFVRPVTAAAGGVRQPAWALPNSVDQLSVVTEPKFSFCQCASTTVVGASTDHVSPGKLAKKAYECLREGRDALGAYPCSLSGRCAETQWWGRHMNDQSDSACRGAATPPLRHFSSTQSGGPSRHPTSRRHRTQEGTITTDPYLPLRLVP